MHGRLSRERIALSFAREHGVPVPSLVGEGRTSEGQLFLVLSQEDGIRATVPSGWYRLGRDLATLAGVPIDGCPLPRVSPCEFAQDHRNRLGVVESTLDAPVVRRIHVAIERIGHVEPLTLTHGDPGSGNYLDNGEGGVILDWENATIAPFGVDIGRAAFISLMDLGHTGVAADLHAAVVRGYRDGLRGHSKLSEELLAASIVVAGLQFIHGRFVRPLRSERTPRAAAAVLDSYLAMDATYP
ncbi:aminoglycoside phosphotransferase family protein [Actinopolymorpha sp. B9G3]|uniref:aminoglycoside phosphotransferase family protein n=1 Tax=Actinopolymorpha sp. B9G3 TaxID=3158970 RepID=UPI0032D8C65C